MHRSHNAHKTFADRTVADRQTISCRFVQKRLHTVAAFFVCGEVETMVDVKRRVCNKRNGHCHAAKVMENFFSIC